MGGTSIDPGEVVGDFVRFEVNVGTILNFLLLTLGSVVVTRMYRCLRRIERFVTPTRTDERGIRYYPSEDDLEEEDVQRLRELRDKHRREIEL